MNAYILSHNGLGDNISMIGEINFLLKYYDNVYFLCKDKNQENVARFFHEKPVIVIPYNDTCEYTRPAEIIEQAITNQANDIFVCGFAHAHIARYRRVQNQRFLQYEPNNKNYTIKSNWQHIQYFYRDARMDLSIYYDYFDIQSTADINYQFIQTHSTIVFMHTKSSKGEITIDLDIDQRLNNNDTIIICANKNVYPTNHPKYEIADKYIDTPITAYMDVIKNATEIHVVDSCFSCIVYPLQQTNCLKATKIIIYDR